MTLWTWKKKRISWKDILVSQTVETNFKKPFWRLAHPYLTFSLNHKIIFLKQNWGKNKTQAFCIFAEIVILIMTRFQKPLIQSDLRLPRALIDSVQTYRFTPTRQKDSPLTPWSSATTTSRTPRSSTSPCRCYASTPTSSQNTLPPLSARRTSSWILSPPSSTP